MSICACKEARLEELYWLWRGFDDEVRAVIWATIHTLNHPHTQEQSTALLDGLCNAPVVTLAELRARVEAHGLTFDDGGGLPVRFSTAVMPRAV